MTRRVLTVGEGLGVLRAREVGSLAIESNIVLSTGGAEGNVAIGLARLGTLVTWLGRVGNDAIGRRVVRELRAEGVSVVAPVDANAPTGVLIKSTPSIGHTDVMYYRAGSAGSRLSVEDLETIEITDYDLLHVTGITPALSVSASTAITEIVARARAAEVLVSVDVNHRTRLWTDNCEAIRSHRKLVKSADIVFAGEDEASMLVGPAKDPADLAVKLSALGPAEVVIKLGAQGALSLVAGALLACDAEVVSVVDTVGAGDAFVAGYLSELLLRRSAYARLVTATRTGAAACTNAGDWEGAATRQDLEVKKGDPVNR